MTTFTLNRRQTVAGLMAATAFGGRALARETAPAPEWMRLAAGKAEPGVIGDLRIEGDIPLALSGDLYRNGPGLFERDGYRKRSLLDGDGIVQRLSFRDGKASYRSAFVETPKFREEREAGKYLYSTWSAPRPGGPLKNLGGGPMESQAGVTVYPVGSKIIAFDETNPGFEVDGETLATLGSQHFGDPETVGSIKAHAKFDPVRKEWLFIGQEFGRKFDLHAITHDETGAHRSTLTLTDTRQVYIHDFLATEKHFVFIMHPCEMHPLAFLAGTQSIIETMKWNAAAGNQIILLPRDGGAPIYVEAPAAFMWHALNAYEENGEIVADFVAYDEPDHFIGDNPQLAALMKGRLGNAKYPGKIRRYRIDAVKGSLKEEIVDSGNHEFPMTDPRVALGKHRVGYFAAGGSGPFQSGVKRFDYETGAVQKHDFGTGVHVGEPVFAPKSGGAIDEGWIIAQALDGGKKKTFFSVFDAQGVSAGPVANIWLDRPMPVSFHGAWKPV